MYINFGYCCGIYQAVTLQNMALTHLRLSNFITISELDLELYDGLSVITGESGVGKSVLFNALYTVLGKQVKASVIRAGEQKCSVEAVFDVRALNIPIIQDFSDNGTEPLILYREFREGKSPINKINSKTVPLKVLREVSEHLAISVGQHEQLFLTKADYQLQLLDKYADNEAEHNAYSLLYQQYQALQKRINDVQSASGIKEDELDFLNFQIQDIGQHNFELDEEEHLKDQKQAIKEAQKNKNLYHHLNRSLSNAVQELQNAQTQAISLSVSDDLQTRLNDCIQQSESLSFDLSQQEQSALSAGTASLDDIESRLDIIFQYNTKYRCQHLNELIDKYNSYLQKRDNIEKADHILQELYKERDTLSKELRNAAEVLRKSRQEAATRLKEQLIHSLKELEFTYVDFDVQFSANDSFTANGSDQIDFMISVNKGQPLNILSKVSSGGELSRILLAFYSIFSQSVPQGLILFDEVDTGVGGLTGNALGLYLKKIGTHKQVLCITHLAQIAKQAQQHIHITKEMTSDGTNSQAVLLSETDKQQELTRMLGGEVLIQELL